MLSSEALRSMLYKLPMDSQTKCHFQSQPILFFLVKDLNPCPSCCKGGRRNINFRISVGSNLNHYRSAPGFPSQVRAAVQMLHAYHIIPCITFTFSFRFTFHIVCIYIWSRPPSLHPPSPPPPHGLGPQVPPPLSFYLQAIGSISEVQLRIC